MSARPAHSYLWRVRNFFTGVRYFTRGLGWVARRPGQWLFGGLGRGAARP